MKTRSHIHLRKDGGQNYVYTNGMSFNFNRGGVDWNQVGEMFRNVGQGIGQFFGKMGRFFSSFGGGGKGKFSYANDRYFE